VTIPKKIISLVISENQINFMEFYTKKNKLELLSFGAHDCNYEDKEELNKIFKTISNSVKKPKYTYITLVDNSFLKHTYLIKGGSADPKSVILQEFKTIYDIKLNEYYIDFYYEEIDSGLLTFCCGIKKSKIDPLLEILVKNDFKLLSLVPGIISISNGIIRSFESLDCVYLNLFNNRLIIALVSEKHLFTFREINYGLNDIIEHLAQEGGVSFEEVSKIIFTKGLSNNIEDERDKNIYDLITESFDKISMEIQKTLDYYSMTYRRKRIDNFILSFGFKNIPGVDDYFKRLFGITIHKMNLKELINFSDTEEELFELKYLDICISAVLQ
jgi:hypothetical protein